LNAKAKDTMMAKRCAYQTSMSVSASKETE
jgi:hypothetical protein